MELWGRLNAGLKIAVVIVAGVLVGSVLIGLARLTGGERGAPTELTSTAAAAPTTTAVYRSAGPTMNPQPGRAYKVDDCVLCGTPPGTWETSGAPGRVGGGLCEWIVQARLSKNPADIIATGTTGPGVAARVDLEVGQFFTSTNCQPWRHLD